MSWHESNIYVSVNMSPSSGMHSADQYGPRDIYSRFILIRFIVHIIYNTVNCLRYMWRVKIDLEICVNNLNSGKIKRVVHTNWNYLLFSTLHFLHKSHIFLHNFVE